MNKVKVAIEVFKPYTGRIVIIGDSLEDCKEHIPEGWRIDVLNYDTKVLDLNADNVLLKVVGEDERVKKEREIISILENKIGDIDEAYMVYDEIKTKMMEILEEA